MRFQLIPLASAAALLGSGQAGAADLASAARAGLPLQMSMRIGAHPLMQQRTQALRLPQLKLQLSPLLATTVPGLTPLPPFELGLLNQARLWQSRNRDDLALEALNKLLRAAPDQPQALAQLARLYLRTNRREDAQKTLDRLRAVSRGDPEVARIETLLRLGESGQDSLREARLLVQRGRPEQAVALLDRLYGAAPPSPDLALEYWQTVAETERGWERAEQGLRQLLHDYPDNYRYQLAYADHIISRRPDDPRALATLRRLSLMPLFEKPARSSWRRAMLKLEPKPGSVALIEAYLAQEKVEDAAVKEHLSSLRAAIEAHRKLLADPYYQAQLQGLALLASERLEEAEDKLQRAWSGRPDDPEVLGGLGVLRMRQGHHAEAQAWFEQARRKDPASSRWPALLRTAQFWGLMREASDAADADEPALAEFKLKQARALDPAEPAALAALGRAYLAQGRSAEAEQAWRQVLRQDSSSSTALEGLASLYLRSGREQQAQELLARAAPAARPAVRQALDSARLALWRERAEAALKRGERVEAIGFLERAAQVDQSDPWLRYDLARLYAAEGQGERGIALFERLLQQHGEDPAARYAQALFVSSQGQELSALSSLEKIAAGQRNRSMSELQRRLWSAVVSKRANELASAGRIKAALALLEQAEQQLGQDVELLLQLADARMDAGDLAGARARLSALAAGQPPASDTIDWQLSLARLQARAEDEAGARASLARLASAKLDRAQTERLNDIRLTLVLRESSRLRGGGRAQAALELLAPLQGEFPSEPRLLSEQARIARALGRHADAAALYAQRLALQPEDRDTAISLIEARIAAGQLGAARRELEGQLQQLEGLTPDQLADLIGALQDLHEEAQAAQLTGHAMQIAPGNARILGFAADAARRSGQLEQAIGLLQRSLAAQAESRAGYASALSSLRELPTPDGARITLELKPAAAQTVAAQAEGGYAWRRLAEMLDRGTTWISSAAELRTRSGTPGISEYRALEVPIEARVRQVGQQRYTFHADLVRLNSGVLGQSEPVAGLKFGSLPTCASADLRAGCSGSYAQQASGLTLHAAVEQGSDRIDLGTTPIGFPVQTLIGGYLHKGDLGPFGYSVELSRRPVAGSQLSYAGVSDPVSGRTWGGVTANGLRLGLSLDEGGRYGAWSSLGLHRLLGRNVETNDRVQLMGGVVTRLINEDDRLLQAGITGMVWRHSDNVGEYTFGHGGYFSPQSYRSLSFPVTFARRHARWSYSLRGSFSMSRSSTADAPYFPTDAAMQEAAVTLANATAGSPPFYRPANSNATSFGRSINLAVEYQSSPRLFLGGRIDLERSPDYAPNRFIFYLRWALDRDAARPVSFLPEAPSPVSQY